MPLYNVPNASAGMDSVIIDIVKAVPIFIPMILLFVFGVVFFGGLTSQKRRTGLADVPLWATIAGISTIMVSLPMTLTTGIIQLETLVILVVVTIFSGFWLFFDRSRNEI